MNPESTFPKVERMLYDLAWKSARRHPYPTLEEAFEEARSVAHLAFVEACASYDPKRASFTTHCWFHTWCKLKSAEMKHSKAAARLPTVPLTVQDEDGEECERQLPAPVRPHFHLNEFLEDIGADAREIISMLIETPHELMNESSINTVPELVRRAKRYFGQKWNDELRVKRALRELKAHVEWSLERT